ncbi:uncharacterized protein LOC118183330 [Stegodyphus dumicola]|uniref:uncharacterized protein LOC118183330 n=1 Tax=Stegodyphus dumicola TaxID=202533 RepID=UPI0015A7CBD4|nr:uncharacterized protein LOC118183330 [Stegodyphus dumicola]
MSDERIDRVTDDPSDGPTTRHPKVSDLAIVMAIKQNSYVHFSGMGIPYTANHVQNTYHHAKITVCCGVEIKRLSVPRWIENGTESSITLDCEYIYNENDIRLVVKWFFEENLEPVYQWIPELGVRHTSGILNGRLDLDYAVNTVDAYSRYRALKISQPSTELSGKYTCLVTSLAGQDSRAQLMTVFVPAQTVDVKYHSTSSHLNVSCEAKGLFPRPKLQLYRILSMDRSPAVVKDVQTSTTNSKDLYNAYLHRNFEHKELSSPGTAGFECVVEIPGTNYQMKKRVTYYAGMSQFTCVPWPTMSQLKNSNTEDLTEIIKSDSKDDTVSVLKQMSSVVEILREKRVPKMLAESLSNGTIFISEWVSKRYLDQVNSYKHEELEDKLDRVLDGIADFRDRFSVDEKNKENE